MKGKGGAFFEQGILRWQALNKREQRLIIGGLLLISLAVIYFVLFQPAWLGRERARAELPALRADVAKIESLADEANRLSNVRVSTMSRAAVRAELQQMLTRAGLDSRAKLDAGSELIKVKFDQVGFEAMMAWLYAVVRDVKLRVVDVSITRDTSAGRVAGTVSLEKPSARGGA